MTCRPRPTRRSRADIDAIEEAIIAAAEREQPTTVRHLFYVVAGTGLIEKTEAEYKGTVVRLLTKLRREGRLPWHWIADGTRWIRKPTSYSSAEEAVRVTAQCYRRAMWASQSVDVEIWCEKDAIAGTIYPTTASFDVPLMVCRGYPSLSFLHSSASAMAAADKPTIIGYVGDFDPSGVNIATTVENTLREFAPDAEIIFRRLAVTEHQIAAFELPTRPTKKSDSRSKGWEGESVDVDSMPPHILRGIVEQEITSRLEPRAWAIQQEIEEQERGWLEALATAEGGQA